MWDIQVSLGEGWICDIRGDGYVTILGKDSYIMKEGQVILGGTDRKYWGQTFDIKGDVYVA